MKLAPGGPHSVAQNHAGYCIKTKTKVHVQGPTWPLTDASLYERHGEGSPPDLTGDLTQDGGERGGGKPDTRGAQTGRTSCRR